MESILLGECNTILCIGTYDSIAIDHRFADIKFDFISIMKLLFQRVKKIVGENERNGDNQDFLHFP